MHRSPKRLLPPVSLLPVWLWPALAGCGGGPSTAAPPPAAAAGPAVAPVPLPGPRHGHCAVRLPGGTLAFGGFGGGGPDRGARATWWLPDGGGRWQPRAAMATPRGFCAGCVVDGVAFAVGDGVERYDMAADRWDQVVPAGQGLLPRSHHGAAVVAGTVYVVGGLPREQSGCFAVDVASGAVRALPPPPDFSPGDHLHLVAGLGAALHVVGGLDQDSFQPQRDHHVWNGQRWCTLPPAPQPVWRKFAAAAVVDGRWLLFGEDFGCCFTPDTGRWSRVAPLGELVAMPAAVARDGEVWLLGGLRPGGPRAALLRRYDVAADRWLP